MFSTSLLSSVLLALAASANPIVTVRDSPVTLQISRSLNTTDIVNLYQKDFNRVQALKAHGTDNVANQFISTPAVQQGTSYIATVGIGNPPTSYNLLIDTGSSYTWVGASKRYVKTRSSTPTASKVSVDYNSGRFSGDLYIDTITLAPRFAFRQAIGVASAVGRLFQLYDWVRCIDPPSTRPKASKALTVFLGELTSLANLAIKVFNPSVSVRLGPVNLTAESITAGPHIMIPTVTDNLFATHMIQANLVAISFRPFNRQSVINGLITWGAVDKSKFTGSITYVPITTIVPSRDFWGIMQTMTYGRGRTSTLILSNAVGTIDTGTTLLLIASDAFARYRAATGATLDPIIKLLTITPAGFARMQSLFFKIGPTTFEFTANAQIWPRALNTAVGGAAGRIYLVVTDIGQNSGQGMDFVNGQVWLERFYSVYDTTNKRVGIANTPFTTAKTN